MDNENNFYNYNQNNEGEKEENLSVKIENMNFSDSSKTSIFSKNNRKIWWILSVISLIVIIFSAYWFIYEKKGNIDDSLVLEEKTEDQEIKNKISPYLLKVENQLSGSSVSISSVSLSAPSWIVIREDLDGKMGNILGALWLSLGSYENQTVELLRETVSGKKYYALVFFDDGDKKFDQKNDLPFKNDNGEMIISEFKTLSEN
ncbi:MAG: hypothetical protein PHZ25_01615 [Candidatus Pacebacteria bacterium]|nr:hypothetical protein [Candidatus Paceibacterota bacterium]